VYGALRNHSNARRAGGDPGTEAGRARSRFYLRTGLLTNSQLAELDQTRGPYVSLMVDKVEEQGLALDRQLRVPGDSSQPQLNSS
jgi:hypothetical protein